MSYSKTKGQFRTKVSGTFRTRMLSLQKPFQYRPYDANELRSGKAVRKEGLCECGCGKQTSSIVTGNSREGYTFGGFRRFIAGHQWILKRAAKPEGWKSSYEIVRERNRLRIDLARKVSALSSELKTNVVDFATVQKRFSPSIFGKPINNNGVSKMLRIAAPYASVYIPKLISVRIVTPPLAPISEYYPYFGSAAKDELVGFVDSIVQPILKGDCKAEVSQDMLLALISGELRKEEARRALPKFIKRYYLFCGRNVSLDAPISDDDQRSWYDKIDNLRPFGTNFYQPDEYTMRKEEFEEEQRYDQFFITGNAERRRLEYSLAQAL